MNEEQHVFEESIPPKSDHDLIMERFKTSVRRLPRYGRLSISLLRDDRLPLEARSALVAGAVYVISPVDLIPGFIPVLGQLDDLLVALLGIRFALSQTPESVRDEHLERAGLYLEDFDEDLRTVRDTSIYLLKAGGKRIGSGAVRLGRRAWRSIRPNSDSDSIRN